MSTDSIIINNDLFLTNSYKNTGVNVDKILVTDADLITTPTKQYLASALGMEIYVATSILNIVALLSKEKFDIVILDISIPDIKQLKILDLIKMSNDNCKVILAYDNNTLDLAIELMSKGSYDLLKKPYDTTRLVEALKHDEDRNTHEDIPVIEYGMRDLAEKKINSEICSFMIEKSQDVIYTTDNNGVITFINSRAESLLGFNESEIIGKHYSVLVHYEDIEEANRLFYEQMSAVDESRNYELRLKCNRGDKEPVLFDIRSTPFPVSLINKDKESEPGGIQAPPGTYCVARDITERKKVEELINHNAHHDYLTGLPDRVLIDDRIDAAIAQSKRSKKKFSVMFLDLNGFKEINDTYGHSMGDALLQAVSARVKGCIREVDTLARVGGDEFMLLVTQIDEQTGVNRIVHKIISEIEKPYNLMGQEMTLSASIGVAMYPDDGENREALINSSDMAMYQAKRADQGDDDVTDYQFPPEM